MLPGEDHDDFETPEARPRPWRWLALGLTLALLVPVGLWWGVSSSQRQVRVEPVRQVGSADEFAEARRFWQALRARDHQEMRSFLEERHLAGTASSVERVALASLLQDAGLIEASAAVLAQVTQASSRLDGQSRTVLARQAQMEGRLDTAVAEMASAVQEDPSLLADRKGRPRGFVLELVMDLARRGRPRDVLDLLPMAVVEQDRTLHPFVINAGLEVRDRDLVLLLLTSPLSPFQGIARDRVLASAYDIFEQPDLAEEHFERAVQAAVQHSNATELKLIAGTALARGRFALARRAYAAGLDCGGQGFFGVEELDRYAWTILRSVSPEDADRELAYLARRFPEVSSFRVAGEYNRAVDPALASPPSLESLTLQGTWAEIRAATEAWLLLPQQADQALAGLAPWHRPDRNPDPAVAVAYICSLASVGRTAEAWQHRQALASVLLSPPERARLAQFLVSP